MPLIFLVSGLAVNFVWGKYTAGRFAVRRVWRLLVPLIFGMAIIVPPQAYFEALGKGVIEPGFLAFMAQYLTFQDFPDGAWGGVEIITWTWNHLWYLPYLLFYTLLLIPIAKLLDRSAGAVRNAFQGLRSTWLVLVPIIPLLIYGNFIYPRFPYISHDLINDWYAHAQYFTFFFYGFLIGRDAGIWADLANMRKITLPLAVTSFVLVLVQRELFVDGSGFWADQASAFIVYLNRWIWIVAVLLFFSLSASKRSVYIMPAAPAVAILVAGVAQRFMAVDMRRRRGAILRCILGGLSLLLVFAGSYLGLVLLDDYPLVADSGRALALLLIGVGVATLVTLLWMRSAPAAAPVAFLSGLCCIYLLLGARVLPDVNIYKSARPFCERVNQQVRPSDPLAAYRQWKWRASYVYYTDRRIGRVGSAGALREYWAADERVYLLVEEDLVTEVRSVLGSTEPLFGRRIGSREVFLFSNR